MSMLKGYYLTSCHEHGKIQLKFLKRDEEGRRFIQCITLKLKLNIALVISTEQEKKLQENWNISEYNIIFENMDC